MESASQEAVMAKNLNDYKRKLKASMENKAPNGS